MSCFASSADREAFWQGMPVPTTRQDEQRYLAKSVALAQRCGARNGDLLAHISTADTARDLDYLRGLVGDSRLTFYGESTGSFLGETYANLFPHRVRAMALDGVEDPVSYTADLATVLANILSSTDQVFHEFLRLCEQVGPARCALAGHGPVDKRVEGMLRQMRHHPIPAPSAEPPGELTYGEALTLLKLAVLPVPAIWPDAAGMLDAAAQGDASAAETIARGAEAEPFHRSFEQSTALLCADSPAKQNARQWPQVVHRLEGVSRIGGPVMGWLHAACAAWPTGSPDRYTGPWNASTPNPILLIGTRFDPTTPLANARLAERRLGNAVLLIHDGYGHISTSDPSTCVNAGARPLLRRPHHACARDSLPVRSSALRPRFRPGARGPMTRAGGGTGGGLRAGRRIQRALQDAAWWRRSPRCALDAYPEPAAARPPVRTRPDSTCR